MLSAFISVEKTTKQSTGVCISLVSFASEAAFSKLPKVQLFNGEYRVRLGPQAFAISTEYL